MYDEEVKKVDNLTESLKDRLDGTIDMDLHGNWDLHKLNQVESKEEEEGGIKGTGTYILRNGKLVEGEGAKREQATFSNWYCSNADPEDIRRHRELMDRMNYRGPKWDGIGVPKSIIEEKNPIYRKVEGEKHPSEYAADKEGKKEFEYVVR